MLVIHKEQYDRVLAHVHNEAFEEKVKFLSGIKIFNKLTEEDKTDLSIVLNSRKYQLNSVLMRENEPIDHVGQVPYRPKTALPDSTD